MNRKLWMFAVLLGSVVPLCGADYHWSFDKRIALKPYPQDAAERVKIVPDAAAGAGALAVTNVAGQSTSAYSFVNLDPAKRVLTLTLQQKMTVEGDAPARFTITLYFNRKGGRQGSAGGTRKLVFEGAEEYRAEKRVVPVPEGAAAMQLVVGVDNGAKTLYLDDLKCAFAEKPEAGE